MLVTLSRWQFLDVSDRIWILVTIFECWCPTLILKDRECWWQKRSKLSPTSQSCHSHISSPTSVTNIDVADWYGWDSQSKLRSRNFLDGILFQISSQNYYSNWIWEVFDPKIMFLNWKGSIRDQKWPIENKWHSFFVILIS